MHIVCTNKIRVAVILVFVRQYRKLSVRQSFFEKEFENIGGSIHVRLIFNFAVILKIIFFESLNKIT